MSRYVRVLETVAAFPRGLTLTELVTILNLPKTTVHRLLQGLISADMLAAKNPRFGPYVLGERFLGLLHSSLPDKWAEGLARPILKELVELTGDTCFLARLTGNSVRSVAMATPENDVHVYVVPGRELAPLYAASSKAILAFQDASVVASVLEAADLKAPVSVRARHVFTDELATVKRDGVAYNHGEDIAGFAAVAAPVQLRSAGVIYSVAITGTHDKLMTPKTKERLSDLAKLFAKRLANAIDIRLSQET